MKDLETWRMGLSEIDKLGIFKIQIEPKNREGLAVGYAWGCSDFETVKKHARYMAAAPDLINELSKAVKALQELKNQPAVSGATYNGNPFMATAADRAGDSIDSAVKLLDLLGVPHA